MARIDPTEDRVVVRAVTEPDRSPGGIIIPDVAKEKPKQGEVVAVGPGKVSAAGVRLPMTLRPGDRVLYGKYSGSDIVVAGDGLLIMRESDVLAVIDG